jgi:hypothetical protein
VQLVRARTRDGADRGAADLVVLGLVVLGDDLVFLDGRLREGVAARGVLAREAAAQHVVLLAHAVDEYVDVVVRLGPDCRRVKPAASCTKATPGARSAELRKLCVDCGSASIIFCGTTVATSEVLTSLRCSVLVTTIASRAATDGSARSTDAVSPTCTVTGWVFAMPAGPSTRISYEPGARPART